MPITIRHKVRIVDQKNRRSNDPNPEPYPQKQSAELGTQKDLLNPTLGHLNPTVH